MQGRVKWFNEEKGYGFIEPVRSDGSTAGKDIFVHFSGIAGSGYRSLNEADLVRFDTETDDKGVSARNVEKIDKLEPDGDGDASTGP